VTHTEVGSTNARRIRTWCGVSRVLFLAFTLHAAAEESVDVLRAIPNVPATRKHLMTIEDLLRLRDIDSLSVSADGSHFAILVRQGIPERNTYRTGWFAGAAAGGDLVFIGDGGDARLLTFSDGTTLGELTGGPSRWSPDGIWVAYALQRQGEVQLWRSRRDGRVVEQLTHNAADVRDFRWGRGGEVIYFTVSPPRAELERSEQLQSWHGYYFNDFARFSEIINPGYPPRADRQDLPVWVVDLKSRSERNATSEESESFERLRRADASGEPVINSSHELAWLARSNGNAAREPTTFTVTTSSSINASERLSCKMAKCSGPYVEGPWWSADGGRVLFWNLDTHTGMESALYAWSPKTGSVSALVDSSEGLFKECTKATKRLLCLRETGTQPVHVAAIDTQSGAIEVVADVNPEIKNIRFGNVERFEWDVPTPTPKLFPKRCFGYVLYPPNFDAARKYPVFIAPYSASGFHRGDVGDEQPLFAYAANGIVVLHTSFPFATSKDLAGAALERALFSSELGFPYLTTMMKSTLRALDLLVARGFVDDARVGIGGVSQGSGNSLYMLTKEHRIAAASVGGGYIGPWLYYSTTPRGRAETQDWYPAPVGAGLSWWNPIDIAQHVDSIRAPILFNISALEIEQNTSLLRSLEDAAEPFDAYVFPGEYHEKWQPAHRQAIYQRNLDWFRFWLQEYEDPDPGKAEQYQRWRELRKLRDAQDTKRAEGGTESLKGHG